MHLAAAAEVGRLAVGGVLPRLLSPERDDGGDGLVAQRRPALLARKRPLDEGRQSKSLYELSQGSQLTGNVLLASCQSPA